MAELTYAGKNLFTFGFKEITSYLVIIGHVWKTLQPQVKQSQQENPDIKKMDQFNIYERKSCNKKI